jgi:hypothetical protein
MRGQRMSTYADIRYYEDAEPTDDELDAIANEYADAFEERANQHRKGE